ncbi:hypothetical protein EDD22DRAFT_884930 [Suillus occidentalis]|nr:hypothetical protein EDD22DRAFT_884930 [Suillus occidentalis]
MAHWRTFLILNVSGAGIATSDGVMLAPIHGTIGVRALVSICMRRSMGAYLSILCQLDFGPAGMSTNFEIKIF